MTCESWPIDLAWRVEEGIVRRQDCTITGYDEGSANLYQDGVPFSGGEQSIGTGNIEFDNVLRVDSRTKRIVSSYDFMDGEVLIISYRDHRTVGDRSEMHLHESSRYFAHVASRFH